MFPFLLGRRQKPRLLPPATELLSDKRAWSALGRTKVDPKGAGQGWRKAQKRPQACFSNNQGR